MERLGVQIYTAAPFKGGAFLADYTYRCQPIFSTNQYGFASASIQLTLTRMEMVQWSDRLTAWLVITYFGSVIWEGRIEDFAPEPGDGDDQVILTMTAYGGIRGYTDLPYTAMWSATKTEEWQQVDTINLAARQPGRYSMDTNSRLYIAINGGEAIELGAIGSMTYAIPHGSSRQIVAVSFDYSLTAPNATWAVALERRTDAFGFQSTVWSLNGNGATQTGTVTLSGMAACDRLILSLYFNRSATTLGTAVAADATVAVTPGTMTGIIKGSLLSIGGIDPEEVEVISVTATTFTAHYRYAHTTADSVAQIWDGKTGDISLSCTNVRVKTTSSTAVYADEIMRDLTSVAAAVNPNFVSTSTGAIQSPLLDLRNETYRDMSCMAIVEHLLAYGDAANNVWEFQIWENLLPIYRVRGSGGRTWYMDMTPWMERALDALYNSAYAVYSDAGGVERRSTTNTSPNSQWAGITRRMAISANTDNATQAETLRNIALNDSAYGSASGDIPVPALYDARGVRVPLCFARSGDIIVARSLPVTSLSSNDRSRSWVIAATSYDGTAYPPTLTISPEARAPRYASVEQRRQNQK
jgi:hypothetical protein